MAARTYRAAVERSPARRLTETWQRKTGIRACAGGSAWQALTPVPAVPQSSQSRSFIAAVSVIDSCLIGLTGEGA